MCWLPSHQFVVEDCDLGGGDLADYFDLHMEGDGYDFVLLCCSAYREFDRSDEVNAKARAWIATDLAKPRRESRIHRAFEDAEIEASSPEARAAALYDHERDMRRIAS